MPRQWLDPSWHKIATGGSDNSDITTNTNNALFQWGMIQFQIYPLNIHEFDHDTETDWAKKEIAGAAIYREWVGENDERYLFRGRLFPYRIGGISEISAFDEQRRKGIANLLIRGDGTIMGWFVVERLIRANTFLSMEGLGQQVAFECSMVRVPVPSADGYWASQYGGGLIGGN